MKVTDHDSKLTFDSPVGAITLLAKGDKIVFLTMGTDITDDYGKSPVLPEAKKQISSYLEGKKKVLDFATELHGTEFQKAVWKEISKIGFGEVTTYAEIAKNIGNPIAVRAVGGAVGSNPVPLIVGCHRVLGASGKITGYSGGDGLPTKRWLLALEGIETKD